MTNVRERALVLLLRLGGAITFCAFLAMFLPVEWMAVTHERLGMGEFPRVPVVDYLTRSIAALYGFHGCLLLLVSRDPDRLAPVVVFVGVMNVVYGAALVAIDLHAGMPWFWTVGEGPPVLMFGIAILWLGGCNVRSRR